MIYGRKFSGIFITVNLLDSAIRTSYNEFKVVLWGGVKFPTGSIVCEERKLPNG